MGASTISELARRAGIGGTTLAVIEQLERHPDARVLPPLDKAVLEFDMALADTARTLMAGRPK